MFNFKFLQETILSQLLASSRKQARLCPDWLVVLCHLSMGDLFMSGLSMTGLSMSSPSMTGISMSGMYDPSMTGLSMSGLL